MHKRGVVIDASLVIDLFAAKEEARALIAEKVFRCISSRGVRVYAPRLFLAEVAGVLVRYLQPSVVKKVIDVLKSEVALVGDEAYFRTSLDIALATGSRGADSYYLGLTKTLNLLLVTSDKVQAQNARKAGIKSFYILDNKELEELKRSLSC